MTDIYSRQARNRRITVLLIFGFFISVLLIGLSVDIYTFSTLDFTRVPVATLPAASFAGVNSFVSYYYGSSLVLRSLGAQELTFDDFTHKKLHNVVTEMALASALEKISSNDSPLKSARKGTAHLFICNPLKRRLDDKKGLVADVFSTHPPVGERVARLKKMAYAYGQAQV